MKPLPPVHILDLFPKERAALLALLEQLTPEQWAAPTVCAGWSVKDIAAHVIADDLGIVARGRDGWPTWFDAPSWEALLAYINRQNEEWVQAMRRLSPQLIIELLRFSGERAFAQFRAQDLDAIGHPVDWAGPEPAPVWLDVAREYTERWLHQQQIRDAVDAPGLYEPRLFAPVLDTFARALRHTYRDTKAPEGTHVRLIVTGTLDAAWSLVRSGEVWGLYDRVDHTAAATVTMDAETAWRMYTKGIDRAALRERARIEGDVGLGEVVLGAVGIIA